MEYNDKSFVGNFWTESRKKVKGSLYINKEGKGYISTTEPILTSEKLYKTKNKPFKIYGDIINFDLKKTKRIKSEFTYTYQRKGSELPFYSYLCNDLLIADYVKEIDNIDQDKYHKVSFTSEIIENWINISGLIYKDNSIENENIEFSQFYKKPKNILLFKNEDFSISVNFGFNYKIPVRRYSEFTEEIMIVISFEKLVSKKLLDNLKQKVQRLISIVLFNPIQLTKQRYSIKNTTDYEVVRINNQYFSNIGERVQFDVFKNKSSTLFDGWLKTNDDLNEVISAFFSVYGRKGVLVENRFVTYVSVLEKYHKISINEDESIALSIQKDVAVRTRKNGKKCTTLLNQLFYILFNSKLIPEEYDLLKICNKIVKTRNYHTHLDETKKEHSFSTNEIILANNLLEKIVRELFLSELNLEILIKKNTSSSLLVYEPLFI